MHRLACHFTDQLIDLGMAEDRAFAGVLTPKAEIGQKREGVNAAFLEDAEDHYVKHQDFDYWKTLFAGAFRKMGLRMPHSSSSMDADSGTEHFPCSSFYRNRRS